MRTTVVDQRRQMQTSRIQHRLYMNIPALRLPNDCLRSKSSVFISPQLTSRLIRGGSLSEQFGTARRLYQYLNWTMRINLAAQTVAVMEAEGRIIMVIDAELHDLNGRDLYGLCSMRRCGGWQLCSLRTAPELPSSMMVNGQCLPRGVRAQSLQFERHRMMTANDDLKGLKSYISAQSQHRHRMRYSRLKCIQTSNGRKGQSVEHSLVVELSTFYEAVCRALDDEDTNLVPIVSITSRRVDNQKMEDFSVDYLLPVQVEGDWVGVVYRDGEAVMALMDRYDITNKALLCDPSFNAEDLSFFKNDYNRLRVVVDRKKREKTAPRKMMELIQSVNESPSMSSVHTLPSNQPLLMANLSASSSASSTFSAVTFNSDMTPRSVSAAGAFPPSLCLESSRSSSFDGSVSSTPSTTSMTPPQIPLRSVSAMPPRAVITPRPPAVQYVVVQAVTIEVPAAQLALYLNQLNVFVEDALRQKVYFQQFRGCKQ